MKSSRWLLALLLLQLAINGAFSFSLGLVGLSLVGLAGLKLYYGIKILTPVVANAGMHTVDQSVDAVVQHPTQKHAILSPIVRAIRNSKAPKEIQNEPATTENEGQNPTKEIQDEEELAIAEDDDQKPVLFVPARPVNSDSAPKSTEPPQRTRRALPGGLKISSDLFRWLAKIDDDLCIHRYFCVLGAKPRSFGNLGRLTNLLVLMGGLPEDGWATKMHKLGQQSGQAACPVQCNEDNLQKTVAYMERHLFETKKTTANHQRSESAKGGRPTLIDVED
ncbi:hypothetical protein BIW11_05377 [Tropilaelaps mercedesae]|uniref:Uncharacterized protein n=1 Tax=Tropilaelaps mercedesae TaxID=418985 RepID=A0A1V9Y2H2_9ACAR|nr:hypothetical protein BIW11_05377 [Tropilaelaps mercedesae]